MAVKPTVALRAVLVGGVAIFAKVASVMKAAGGVKLGAAAAAVTAAATAAISGPKKDSNDTSPSPSPSPSQWLIFSFGFICSQVILVCSKLRGVWLVFELDLERMFKPRK